MTARLLDKLMADGFYEGYMLGPHTQGAALEKRFRPILRGEI